jgi:hypothetical protein
MLRQFIIAESEADFTSHAGLGLIGMALERYTGLATDAAAVAPLRSDAIAHRDVRSSYVAMLCLGKSDFEAINSFREDEFFHEALGLKQVPSEGTLRQRMDTHANAFRTLAENAAVGFVRNVGAPVTPLDNGLVPLDCDVTPFDNSKTHKEGVSRTYNRPPKPSPKRPIFLDRWLGIHRGVSPTSMRSHLPPGILARRPESLRQSGSWA